MKQAIEKNIYLFLKVLLVIFFAFGLFFSNSEKMVIDILLHAEQKGYFMIIFWGYIISGMVAVLVFYKLKENKNELMTLFVLFTVAFIPRLAFSFVNKYEPISDFSNYFQFGKYMVEGRYSEIENIITNYGIPKFGGLAVLSGIVAKLFSVKLIGFQLANCVISSCICILIYLIGKKYSREVGIIGCLLYSFYPANIISSLITTNHHGAVLFTLTGIYLFVKALSVKGWKGITIAILSGFSYCISDLIHPSVIIPLIAIVCFATIIMVEYKNVDKYIEVIKNTLITLFSYIIITQIILHILLNVGIIANLNSSSVFLKVVVGVNYETRGGYSRDDVDISLSIPPEKRSSEELKIIKERISSHSLEETFLLIKDKVSNMWWGFDSYFWWYRAGLDKNIKDATIESTITETEIENYNNLTEFLSSASYFDLIYMRIIGILALCGTIFRNRTSENKILDLVIWTLLGWISIHIFIEVQSRYRHLGTPYIYTLAAVGIFELSNKFRLLTSNYIKRKKTVLKDTVKK